MDVKQLLNLFTVAENNHRLWDSEWEEVARYMLPKSGGFYNTTPMLNIPKDTSEIYNSTPRISLRKASGALYAYSANPHTNWFSFEIPTKKSSITSYNDLIKKQSIKDYMAELTRLHVTHLNRALTSSLRYAYEEMVAFSTTGILLNEEEDGTITSHNIELKNLYPLSGGEGKVDTIFRRLELTPQQAASKFGKEALSNTVQSRLDSKQAYDKKDLYLHVIYKRDTSAIDPEVLGGENMPWASVYVDKQNSHIVKESGYPEQPFIIGCLSPIAGQIFGNSPGMDALPAVRSLNKLSYQQLEVGDSALAPAYNVPSGLYKNQLNLNSYALNYYDPERATNNRLAEPISNYAGYQIGTDMISRQEEKVKESLYDLVVLAPTGNTAYEAQQAQISQMILMSPWNYSLEEYFYRPAIQRIKGILERKNALPEMPEELRTYLGNTPLSIVFDNPLAKASQFTTVQAMDRVLQIAGNLAPIGGMDMVDVYTSIELYRELNGAPREMLFSVEQANRKKQEREKAQAEQAQQAQQVAGAEQLSSAYKNIADAERPR
jgi:hypothetical protein